MSDDVYIYEAIDIVPPVGEEEIASKLADGEYTKVTWDDPRIGEGYFARVGGDGMIGIGFIPVISDDGEVFKRGVAVQVSPIDERHRDETLEAELRKIIADFGATPSGVRRVFDRALHIEKTGGEEILLVRDGEPLRLSVV